MKKLLTTMSAVAVAMGLYAADTGALSGTSFEGLAAADRDPYNISATNGEITATSGFWSVGASDTLKVIYGVDVSVPAAETSRRPAAFTESDNDYYLEVKTASLTNSISRRVNADGSAVNINGGTTDTKDLYFDSYVQFTAFEGDDDVKIGSNGKLAIWLRENVDGNGDPTSTNLMITAGYLNNTEAGAVPTNYVCTVSDNARLFDGGWHRVTVKAIDKIYTSGNNPGFVVFIDSYEVSLHRDVVDKTMGIDGTLTENAQAYYDRHALFPSAVQSGADVAKITAVDFAGQGAVDELVFTRTAPWFAEDNEFFKIIVDENIATAYYSLNNGAWVSMDPGSTNVLLYTKDSQGYSTTFFALSNITAAAGSGYMTNGVALANITYNAGSDKYEVDAANATATIQTKPLAATVTGNGTTENCETLADVVTYVNSRPAGSGTFTITLAANASGNIVIDNAGITNILDLAGKTLTGTSTENPAIYVTSGALTVIDTVDGGTVEPAVVGGEPLDAVGVDAGTVAIEAGTYNGKVAPTAISGGKFLASLNDKSELDSVIVGDYVATQVGAYYELAALTWTTLLGDPDVGGAYAIDDTADLLALQRGVLAGLATSSVTFKQTANIDMTGVEGFWGIGWFTSSDAKDASITASGNIEFAGTYDGQGYTLSNVEIVRHNYAGIFNCIRGATIKDMVVSNVTFSGICSEEGFAIVGNSYGDSVLENLTSAGTWPASMRHNAAGIAIRAQHNTLVTGCVNRVSFTTSGKRLGGILAFSEDPASASDPGVRIYCCTNYGNLESSDGTRGVAGILARPEASSEKTTIGGCANYGTLTAGSSGFTGAIVGQLDPNTYTDDGGNTFLASQAIVGDYNGKTVAGLAYAIDAGIDGGNYLTTVKAADLAAGNTYVLLANAAPVFALAAVGDTIAFDTSRGYTLDGSGITYAAGTVTVTTSDTVTTYTAALSSYTITYKYGETVLSGLTPATYTVADAVTLPTENVDLGVVGVSFQAWTNAEGTVVAGWSAGDKTGNQTFYAQVSAVVQTYPSYIDTSDSTIKGQYDTWAEANNVPAGANDYEAAFLLNVAPAATDQTLDVTAIAISGTTVTITLDHSGLNGYVYVYEATTVAGLDSATPVQVTESAGVITRPSSDSAKFYKIVVSANPVVIQQ